MKSIIRKQFLDQTWDSEDLEKAATCWLIIHEELAQKRGIDYTPIQTVEIQLSGFSRRVGDELLHELERRMQNTRPLGWQAELTDADTITMTQYDVGLKQTPLLLSVLPILSGELFDGLAVEVRFALLDTRKLQKNKGSVPTVLLAVAQLVQGKLSVKTLFRDFPDGSNHSSLPKQRISIPDDEIIQSVVQEFRDNDEIASPSLSRLFKSRAMKHMPKPVRWLILVPFYRPRLLALLLRCLVFIAIFASLGLAAFAALEGFVAFLFPLIAFGSFTLLFFSIFALIEICILFSYSKVKKVYSAYYSDLVQYAVWSPRETAEFDVDPLVRKYTTELIGAGFTHLGDSGRVLAEDIKVLSRIFLAPDRANYFTLACNPVHIGNQPKDNLRTWPAQIVFRAQIFFSNGGRAESVGPSIYSFRLPQVDHETLIRVTKEFSDPADFFQFHLEAVEQFSRERDLSPAAPKRLEEFVRCQTAIFEEERRNYFDRPYSWVNHVRWYLQWPYMEIRG